MSFHRVILVVSATLFAVGLSSAAFAGCGGCGFEAPALYAPPVYAQPAPVYAIPAPLPPPAVVAPAPIAVDHWDTGGCGTLGGCGSAAALAAAASTVSWALIAAIAPVLSAMPHHRFTS